MTGKKTRSEMASREETDVKPLRPPAGDVAAAAGARERDTWMAARKG